jgi:hypothetical protein
MALKTITGNILYPPLTDDLINQIPLNRFEIGPKMIDAVYFMSVFQSLCPSCLRVWNIQSRIYYSSIHDINVPLIITRMTLKTIPVKLTN